MARQKTFEGMQRPHAIDEIDAAAEKFWKSGKAQKAAKLRTDDAKNELIRLMRKHGINVYEDRDAELLVTLESTDKVRLVHQDLDHAGDDEAESGDDDAGTKLRKAINALGPDVSVSTAGPDGKKRSLQ